MGIVIGTCIPSEYETAGGRTSSVTSHLTATPDANNNTLGDHAALRQTILNHRRRQHQQRIYDIKCPFCNKFVLSDDIECHLVMCLTKPRLSYNEDVLNDAKGECVICLEDLSPGDIIARLPCLCVYHKGCIDKWFEVNRSCPEHPGD